MEKKKKGEKTIKEGKGGGGKGGAGSNARPGRGKELSPCRYSPTKHNVRSEHGLNRAPSSRNLEATLSRLSNAAQISGMCSPYSHGPYSYYFNLPWRRARPSPPAKCSYS